MFDSKTKAPLSKVAYSLDGYRQIAISQAHTLKPERNQGYSKLLIAELLRRYPRAETVTFIIDMWDLERFQAVAPRDLRVQQLIEQSYVGKTARSLGLTQFQFKKHEQSWYMNTTRVADTEVALTGGGE